MFNQARRLVGLALTTAAFILPGMAGAQTREFQTCSQGALQNCAGIRLTSELGVGPSSTNRFEIGIQNLGSLSMPGVATSIYFASFMTDQAPDANFLDVLSTPVAVGGATVSNAADWLLYEGGDAMILSAAGNDGIGGCTFGAPSGVFGLMGQTCGAGQFITFSFFTSRAFDLNAITLSGLEFVALDANNTADSCSDLAPCVGISTVPEPSSLVLLAAGALAIVAVRQRRRAVNAEV